MKTNPRNPPGWMPDVLRSMGQRYSVWLRVAGFLGPSVSIVGYLLVTSKPYWLAAKVSVPLMVGWLATSALLCVVGTVFAEPGRWVSPRDNVDQFLDSFPLILCSYALPGSGLYLFYLLAQLF